MELSRVFDNITEDLGPPQEQQDLLHNLMHISSPMDFTTETATAQELEDLEEMMIEHMMKLPNVTRAISNISRIAPIEASSADFI